MFPKTHFLSGAVLSLIAYIIFPSFGWNVLFILFGSFLTDVDHLIVYHKYKNDWSPFKMIKFYNEIVKSKKLREKYDVQNDVYVFHTAEFYIILAAAGIFFHPAMLFFAGVMLHAFLDSLNEFDKKHLSLIIYMLKNRQKKRKKPKNKRKTSFYAMFLVVFCTFLTSAGQIFFKLGSKTSSFDLSLITNYNLMIGIVLYATAAFLLIIALGHGELSILYPIIATSYIWVSLLSLFYLNESVSLYGWIGIVSIFIGVSLIGGGSR